jgi:hypothetical protein
MNAAPAHSRNDENFAAFHALQGELTRRLAAHPGVIRAWLQAQPPRESRDSAAAGRLPKSWRTARLSNARRRELAALAARVEQFPDDAGLLAAVLLESMPVCTYLEIAAAARPGLESVDPCAAGLCRRLARDREALLVANYGLAQAAARQRNPRDPTDLLSAASTGLLDAIDRYVPGSRAARFGYFASYWIRYHMSRHAQKNGSVVSFPINQHRIGRRIERYLAEREAQGLPQPPDEEVRADLKLGCDAFYWHRLKPQVVSFDSLPARDGGGGFPESCLCDPGPGPAGTLEEAEIAAQLTALLRRSAPPATRVMLAYLRRVGSLPDAAEDYLAGLHQLVAERVGPLARFLPTTSRAFETACGPASREGRVSGSP